MADNHGHAHDHAHVEATPAPRPLKSEQMQATDAIDEVAPGILRTQLPANITGLGHVNMYVLEDERGVAVVDPGLPYKESWKAVQERLKRIGVPLKRVHSVIVTHSHPDHFGGAGRIRQESGADIITHRLFRMWWDPTEPPDLEPEELAIVTRSPFEHTPWGGPHMDVPWKRRMRLGLIRRLPTMFRMPTPSVRLREAERMTFARREFVAYHTPGHTEDHLCLFDPESGVLLSGDHVLPQITPHISGLSANDDPLDLFFRSLDKVGALADQTKIVLPAHGTPFHNLAERVDSIKQHHHERLDRLRTASAELGRPASVMEMSKHLFSPRAQGPMADSETYAHLEHLRLLGDFECRNNDGLLEYVLS